jgi:ubiquinone/menaquinone biosynthesis C-methylase UbiE
MAKTYWTKESLKRKSFLWHPQYVEHYFTPLLKPKENEIYLDAGCGFSPLGIALFPYLLPAGKVIGIDHDQEIINEAQKYALQHGWSNYLDFRVDDVNHINFPDEFFDAVLCQQLLVNVSNPTAVLLEMKRVCKIEHGRILIVENSNFGAFVVHPELSTGENLHLSQIYQKIITLGKAAFEDGDTSLGSKLGVLLKKIGLFDIYTTYLIPPVPEQNFSYLNNQPEEIEKYERQQEHLLEIFGLWAEKLIPKHLKEAEWLFFKEKVFLEKFNIHALRSQEPMIQLVHPLSVAVGWVSSQPRDQFIDLKLSL